MEKTRSQRFDEKWIDTLAGCHTWFAARDRDGYGIFANGKNVKAHRYAYERAVGPIPEGYQIDHLCRVRHCVNPLHLEAVTGKVNTLRGKTRAQANASKTHCPRRHEYNEANTYRWRNTRECRACKRIKQSNR